MAAKAEGGSAPQPVENVTDANNEAEAAEGAAVSADQAAAAAAVANPEQPLHTKHPLHHVWVLWYDNPGSKRVSQDRWFQHMKRIANFSTVEDFWGRGFDILGPSNSLFRIVNNIRPPSRLMAGSNYHLFKHNIQPMWEDATNSAGGKWVYNIPKKNKEGVDDIWLHLLLAMIGENFDEGEEICGAVASIRKQQDRIAVWTRTWGKEAAVMSIGNQMKSFLELPAGQTVAYVAHSDALKRNSSYSKNRYEI